MRFDISYLNVSCHFVLRGSSLPSCWPWPVTVPGPLAKSKGRGHGGGKQLPQKACAPRFGYVSLDCEPPFEVLPQGLLLYCLLKFSSSSILDQRSRHAMLKLIFIFPYDFQVLNFFTVNLEVLYIGSSGTECCLTALQPVQVTLN